MGIRKEVLEGGFVLRQLIDEFYRSKTKEEERGIYFQILACLRDSEVIVPVNLDMLEVGQCEENRDDDDDEKSKSESTALKKCCILASPFLYGLKDEEVEEDKKEKFVSAYSGELALPDKIKKKYNTLKISFMDCMRWAKAHDADGIILDVKQKSQFVLEDKWFWTINSWNSFLDTKYVYLKVQFKEGGRGYYYTSDRTDLTVGEKVVVPYGQSNYERVGEITNIEEYESEKLPFPYRKVKLICRKAKEVATRKRGTLSMTNLLGEESSFQIIKSKIENGDYPFTFDEFYDSVIGNVSFATGERIRKPYFVPEEEWGKVLEACKEELSALDEAKPLCQENSWGKHYGNELFFEQPIEFDYDGDSFVWAMLSRRFSSVLLPITSKELEEMFWKELEIFSFPEQDHWELELPNELSPLAKRRICRSSMERILIKVKKNYYAYKARMEQLE